MDVKRPDNVWSASSNDHVLSGHTIRETGKQIENPTHLPPRPHQPPAPCDDVRIFSIDKSPCAAARLWGRDADTFEDLQPGPSPTHTASLCPFRRLLLRSSRYRHASSGRSNSVWQGRVP